MLFTGNTFYLNGDAVTFTGESAQILIKLADQRTLSADDLNNSHTLNETLLNQLLDWYLAGFLHLNA
jgi:50S ribosomal protein L16 3-hydroxylase